MGGDSRGREMLKIMEEELMIGEDDFTQRSRTAK